MPKPAKIETYKAILRARGVPERFIDAIARRSGSSPASLVLLVFWLASMAVMAAGFIYLNAIDRFILPLLYPHAAGSLLFFPPVSFEDLHVTGLVLVFMLMMIFAVVIAGLRSGSAKPSPAYDSQAYAMRTLRQGETLETLYPNPAYQALADLPDDTAFLAATRPKVARSRYAVIPFALLPVIFMSLPGLMGLGTYKDVTSDAVRLHMGASTTVYRLADAQYAYVLCGGLGDDRALFDYRLVYPHKTISLWARRDNLHDLSDEQVMQRLAQIDTALTRAGVRVDRMPATGSPRDDALSCIDSEGRYWSRADQALLRRLVLGDGQ